MSIKLYNTLTRSKETFQPVHEGEVRMYVCGPTTYNYIHLGNARPIVVFDTVRRYFTYRGYRVTYVSNFTDVDDKIINRSHEEGKTAAEVAQFYIDAFFEDTGKLNILPADKNPRVSEHMQEIINFVQELIDAGYAYALDNGDVYFAVRKYEDYGQLSGRNIDELMAGARVDVDEKKHDPLDFALWKSAKPGEPAWESPWGQGRPGWHIECSAMSRAYLGQTFDIHGGGQDLIFPHHENEIAQSCSVSHAPMARYWMHNGFITINEEKMSKSLGNFFLLREILDKFPGDVVRYYLLSVHYRSPLDFDDAKIEAAARGLDRLKNAYHNLVAAQATADGGAGAPEATLRGQLAEVKTNFEAGMDDDFNTALGLSALFDLARDVNTYLREDQHEKAALKEAQDLFDSLLYVFGLDFEAQGTDDALADDLMALLIDLRAQARADKQFALADAIRDRLKDLGIVLEDGKNGTTWKQAH